MNQLRKTIRKIILENQLSPEGKVIDLMASWDIAYIRQAIELGETLGFFEAEDTTLGWSYSFKLENCSAGFLAALSADSRSYTHNGEPQGIMWDGTGSLVPIWHTPTTLILTVDKSK